MSDGVTDTPGAPDFCPYVGLAPFEASHADYFFGRGLDSADIADHFLARPITVVYGPSGVGKSSVLNVGLPRALKEIGVAETPKVFRDWVSVKHKLAWLSARRDSGDARLFLVLDQFEEFFLYRDQAEVDAFSVALRQFLRRSSAGAHVLLAMRQDGVHYLDGMRAYLPQAFDTMIELSHLDADAVREAVEGPIAVYNRQHRPSGRPVEFDEDLADTLIEQLQAESRSGPGQGAAAARIELPFLQLALERLWAEEGGGSADGVERLRVSTLRDRLGGIEGIAKQHVEDRLDTLTRAEQRAASKILHYMVTPSGGKIAYTRQDLEEYAEKSRNRVGDVLSALTRQRILRGAEQPDAEAQKGGRYEIFHDVLAKPALAWRARYLETGAFACLRNLFSGKEYELTGFGQIFGRAPPPDDESYDPLTHISISRSQIVVLSNLELLDLRSVNGTTVDARPIRLGEPVPLVSGALVVLANLAPFLFFAVEDEADMPPLPANCDQALAMVVDGTRGAVNYVMSDEAGLKLNGDRGVSVVAADDPEVFATLNARRNPYLLFEPPELRPEVEMIAIEDAYQFPPVTVTSDEWWAIPDDDQLVGARPRQLFRVGDRPFEIVLNHDR